MRHALSYGNAYEMRYNYGNAANTLCHGLA